MHLTSLRSGWPRVRSALWLGVPLGLLQLVLGLVALQGVLDWLLCMLLGACLYFALPAMAGLRVGSARARVAESEEEGQTAGSHAGCLVGQISFVVVTLPALVLAVVLVIAPFLSRPTPRAATLTAALALFYLGTLFLIIFLNAMGGVISYFGGWLGGSLADRWASAPEQGRASSEESPSARD